MSAPTTTISDVGTVAVTVSDQDRALAFYVDTLGFDAVLEWPGVPPMFTFRDPDGNTLYAYEATP